MAFRPDSPIELPNGRLVCGSHSLVVCPICTVDYSFMDEIEDVEDDDEDLDDEDFFDDDSPPSFRRDLRVGTGRVIPKEFTPPNTSDTPQSLFPPMVFTPSTIPIHRFIRENNNKQFLIYTDGACLNNGGENPRAGCSFVYKIATPSHRGFKLLSLEGKGPTGEQHPQTSNRAELRAVIAALRYQEWDREGFDNLVIATDSEYVVRGITTWVRGWLQRKWKTRAGLPVENQDLWKCLLGEMERWDEREMQIQFWLIPREWNTEADRWAKEAATEMTHDRLLRILNLVH